MSLAAFSLVLMAAFLHAVWNSLVKASDDRGVILALISLGHVCLGVILVLMSPLPALESWKYIAASTVIHWAYYYLLFVSYRLGDLSVIYPIARGIAPVLVALGAQFFAGEVLSVQAWGGIFLVSCGILALSGSSVRTLFSTKAAWSALATGVCIAAYSITDGLGVRVADTALGYIGWLFISEIFVTALVLGRRGRDVFEVPSKTWIIGIVGGLISAVAYGMVIYAKSITFLALVSTLREVSVVFAALIGVLVLHERPWRPRLLAALIVVTGVLTLAFSG